MITVESIVPLLLWFCFLLGEILHALGLHLENLSLRHEWIRPVQKQHNYILLEGKRRIFPPRSYALLESSGCPINRLDVDAL